MEARKAICKEYSMFPFDKIAIMGSGQQLADTDSLKHHVKKVGDHHEIDAKFIPNKASGGKLT